MNYRQAGNADSGQLALLHADSWRRTYRGLFSEYFLEHEADVERLQTWTQRLREPPLNQAVIVAEQAGVIQGFICVYAREDPRWGSLIDNLHVRHDARCRGIGSGLLQHAFGWLAEHAGGCGVYLWVMENNANAREFYLKRGAVDAGASDRPNPVGGGSARNCRYTWPSPGQ